MSHHDDDDDNEGDPPNDEGMPETDTPTMGVEQGPGVVGVGLLMPTRAELQALIPPERVFQVCRMHAFSGERVQGATGHTVEHSADGAMFIYAHIIAKIGDRYGIQQVLRHAYAPGTWADLHEVVPPPTAVVDTRNISH